MELEHRYYLNTISTYPGQVDFQEAEEKGWYEGDLSRPYPEITRVLYNNPATIVWFSDGDKVVVKVHNERFDEEKGVAMAVVRKMYGRSAFNKIIQKSKQNKSEPTLDDVIIVSLQGW